MSEATPGPVRVDPQRRAGGEAASAAAAPGAVPERPYAPPRLCRHGRLADLTGAAEGTVNDGAGGFFAFSGAAG
jgi:hypothetical protein